MFRRRARRRTGLWALLGGLAAAGLWLARSLWRRRADVRARLGRRYGQAPPAYSMAPVPAIPDEGLEIPYDHGPAEVEGVRREVPVTAWQQHPAGAAIYPARGPNSESERRPFPWLSVVILAAALAAAVFLLLQGRNPPRAAVVEVPGGNAENGRRALQSWGCGSCHTIPGVPGAEGKVGPRLDQLAEQRYIAGILLNTPDNLVRWIMDPQEIQPGNAMPDTGVVEGTARDMAAYLYSIRLGR